MYFTAGPPSETVFALTTNGIARNRQVVAGPRGAHPARGVGAGRPNTHERPRVERHVARSLEDPDAGGSPLDRRTRQTRRTVEAYLKAGVLPRYMERVRDMEAELSVQRRRLEASYRALQEAC